MRGKPTKETHGNISLKVLLHHDQFPSWAFVSHGRCMVHHPDSCRMCGGGIVVLQDKRSEAESLLELAVRTLQKALNPHHRMVVSAQQALTSIHEVAKTRIV